MNPLNTVSETPPGRVPAVPQEPGQVCQAYPFPLPWQDGQGRSCAAYSLVGLGVPDWDV